MYHHQSVVVSLVVLVTLELMRICQGLQERLVSRQQKGVHGLTPEQRLSSEAVLGLGWDWTLMAAPFATIKCHPRWQHPAL